MLNRSAIQLIVTGIGAIASIGYSIYVSHKTKKQFESMVDDIAGKLSTEVDIDISEEIVDKAVQTSVAREADRQVTKAVDIAVRDIKGKTQQDLSSKVSTAVNSSYSDIKSQVREELQKQLGHIDISEVRKEVIADAKKEVADRLDKDIDEILEDYNKNLKNVSNIYSSIAKTISGGD